jgi:IS5 family transposase
VTDASVHDSQKFDGLLNRANTSADVYADSAYRSAEARRRETACSGSSNRYRPSWQLPRHALNAVSERISN